LTPTGIIDAGGNRSRITDHFSPLVTVTAEGPVLDAVWVWVGIEVWVSALG